MILRLPARLSLLTQAALAAVVAGALLALPGQAAKADIFTVSDVPLDATADSVTAARERAMAEGQVKAVQKLWERLVAPEARPMIPPLSAAELGDYYIQNLQVSGEQTSTNRYIADLTVQFRPNQIRQFLRSNNIPYTETRSQPVLVLPLYGAAGSATLWQGDNPWLGAWQRLDSGNDLVPVVAPLGDLEDLTGIDAGRAAAGDAQALSAMAERYGAGDVLVSRAQLTGDPAAGTAGLQIATQRYPDGRGPGQGTSDSLTQQPGESLPELLERGAARVAQSLQGSWLAQNQLRYDQQSQLQASVPVSSLDELVEVQRRLGQVAAVRDHYTLSVTRTAAEVGLVYYGDPMQLQRALSQVELALEQTGPARAGQPGWQIRLTRAALEIDSAPLGGDGSLETLPATQPQPGPQPGTPAQPAPEGGASGGAATGGAATGGGATGGGASTVRPLTDAGGRPVQVPAQAPGQAPAQAPGQAPGQAPAQ